MLEEFKGQWQKILSLRFSFRTLLSSDRAESRSAVLPTLSVVLAKTSDLAFSFKIVSSDF